MDITVEKLPKSEVKLTFTVGADKFSKMEEKTASDLGQKVKIDGFRPGKAPVSAVKEAVGQEAFLSYLIETNLPMLYVEAIQKEGIDAVSRPAINILEDSPLKIEATVAVKPEVKLKDIDSLNVKEPKIEVTKKELDEAIDSIKKMQTEFKEVDRKVKKGDKVEIDFEGKDKEGKEIEGAKSENHPIVVGDGMFIPGFEENLVGMKKDEDKEFELTFPKDYHHAPLKGKPVVFSVKIKKVEEAVVPELDEAFIEKIMGEKKTKEEFEAELKDNIEHQKIHEAEAKQEEELFEKLLKAATLEVADSLIEEELEALIMDIKRDALQKGQSYEQFAKDLEAKEGKTVEEFFRPRAEERVKIKFILEAVIKEKKIEVSDKEVEEAIKNELDHAPEHSKATVEKVFSGQEGKNRMANKLILDKVFEAFIQRPKHDCKH